MALGKLPDSGAATRDQLLRANYRERQDFKRRLERLRRKILRLSRPEQHHLSQWISDQLAEANTDGKLTFMITNEELVLSLPSSRTEIMAGVEWGDPCALFTPAYWYSQYIMRKNDKSRSPIRHRIGETFAEELTACLLGGYGIPAESAMPH